MGANPAARTKLSSLRLIHPLIFGAVGLFLRILPHKTHSHASNAAASGIQPYCALLTSVQSQARNNKCCGCVAASLGSRSQLVRALPMTVSNNTARASNWIDCCAGAAPHRVQRGFSGNI